MFLIAGNVTTESSQLLVVRFLLGDSPEYEFYMPTFHLLRQVGACRMNSVLLCPNGSDHFRAKPFPV